ncbi:hypothetical protein [Streptomyces bungoensis]|uniref:hypothetical protein n=1 Tax=Streptomyces bungoensis TaxID=285568 RepID=UPI0033E4F28A
MIQQRTRSAATAPAPVPSLALASASPGTPVALLLGASGASGGPDDAAAVSALLEAWACGVATHVVDRASLLAARGSETAALADASSGLDVTRPDLCVAWARGQVAQGRRFDIVLGLRPETQPAAAETAAALGLRGNRPDVVRTVLDAGTCRAALAAEGFLLDTEPPAAGGLAAVGVFAAGRPHIALVAALPADGGAVRTAGLTRSEWAAVTGRACSAVHRLGLEFGVFRVDLRLTGRGVVLGSVRTTLGHDGVSALLRTAVPWLEPYGAVYDDALDRTGPLPVLPVTRPAAPGPGSAAVPAPPLLRLAGDPDDAADEPHLWRGID